MGNPNVPIPNLKPNSDKSKEERKELTPVVKGQVKTKKATVGKKFMDTFFSEDLYEVKNYILRDVLIPGIKDGLYDIFSGSLSMMFYGDAGKKRSGGSSRTRSGYVDYSSYSSQNKKTQVKRNGVYSYNEIIFENREDAVDVKDTMTDLMNRYNEVKIGDYYELAGQDNIESSDWEHGWYDLSDMAITRDRDGWRIRLPKAVPLVK